MTAGVTPERLVNIYTAGEQSQPSLASLANGGYVAVWRSADQNGTGFGLTGQRYNAFGQREGGEFFVETDTVGDQYEQSVAGLPGGGFVVTWRNGRTNEIKAQLFAADGAPVGAEFQVNTETYSTQQQPVATALPGGGFVVLWSSYNNTTFTYDIRGQIYDAAGAAVGGEFTANTTTASQQIEPAAATLPSGFVAVWRDQSSEDVRVQRFDAAGAKVGAETVVNTLTAGTQYEPKVAALTGGGFVVVWTSTSGGDSSGYAVRAQLFDAAGAAVGGEFLVNQSETGTQYEPDVTATADGGFFVAWRSDTVAGVYTYDVVGRQFAADGSPVGDEIALNQNSGDTAYQPAVVGMSNGLVAAAWTINPNNGAGDGDGAAVMQRLFAEDPAAVTLPQAPLIEALSPALTFAESELNAAAQLIDPSVALSDADSADFAGGRLLLQRITAEGDFAQYAQLAQDILGVRDQGSGAGQIGVSGTTVTFGGATIGTIVQDGADGAPLEILLTAAADAEAVETLIENLTYRTLSDDPDPQVQLALTVSDGDGATSDPRVITITVTPEADALQPVGAREITVNSYAESYQYEPDVAGLSGGGFVAVWRSDGQDGSGAGIYSQRFDAAGAPVGAETRVAVANIGNQYEPAVAAIEGGALAGGHVVVWQDASNSAQGYVRARLFGADGAPATDEISVPTALYSSQGDPDVAVFADGSFVVVWNAYTAATNSWDIVSQRFDAAGAQLGGQITINAGTAGTQDQAQVAALAGGGYVVTWRDQNGADGASSGVYARVVNAAGAPVGGDILVNSYTPGNQYEPAVAALTGGGFIIAWRDDGLDGSSAGVFGQRFAADGATVGEQFRVNETTVNSQYDPTVAPLADGGFMIGWRGYGPTGSDEIFVQGYDAAGGRVDGAIQVNVGATSAQQEPSLALLASGEVAAVWTTRDGAADGSLYAVQARVLGDPAAYPAPGDEPLLDGLSAVRDFTEAEVNAAPQLIDADGAVAVADKPGFDGGRVTVARVDLSGLDILFGYPDDERQDQLEIRDQGTGAGQIGVSGATVTFGGVAIGTIVSDGADGGVLEILLNAAATSAAVEALVENLTYANPSDDPAAERVLRVTVSDGAGDATSLSVTVRVSPEDEAPQPLDDERQTNSNIEQAQESPAVAALADGGYVIVWESYDQDAQNSAGIYGQRFDASGARVGGEFPINQNPTNSQQEPAVAGLAGGGFAVVWDDASASAAGYIRVRVFDASGAAVTGEIAAPTLAVNAFSDNTTSIAGLSSGGFVVTWQSYDYGVGRYDIFSQRFDAGGAKVGAEVKANAAGLSTAVDAQVAAAAAGGFSVVWTKQGGDDGSGWGVYARTFDAAGSPVGGDVLVNQTTAGNQYEPSIAALAGGGYVVAWREDGGRDGSAAAVFARLLDAAGAPVGDEFQVNDVTTGSQYQPAAVALADGRFVIAYYSDNLADGSYYDVFAQTFEADGSRVDGAVKLNTDAGDNGFQSQPALAALANGYVAAWTSSTAGADGDGSGNGVFHRLVGSAPAPASDAPVLSDFGPTVTILNSAAATPVLLDPSVSLTDADSANFDGGALTLEWIDFTAGTDNQLGVASGGRVTVAGSDVSVDGVVIGQIDATLNGANGAALRVAFDADATPARVALLVEALTYANTAATPVVGDRGLSVTLTDGDGGVNQATGLIVSIATSAPANLIQLNDVEPTVAFTETQVESGAQLIDGTVDFVYSRAAGLDGGRLEISYVQQAIFRTDGASETLSVANQGTGPGQIGVSGATVSYEGVAIGTVDAADDGLNGADLTIAFNAAATPEAVEALVEAIGYANASDGPAATRQIDFRVYDSASASSTNRRVTLTVTPEDDGGPKPLAGEEQVNSFTPNQQEHPAIAALTGGGHVVLWQSLYQDDESSWGIYGQRYDADGAAVGPEFRVNETIGGSQQFPAVAGLPGGGFAAVWQDSSGRDGSGTGVFARIFDANGVPGGQFQANLEFSSTQDDPAVTVLSNGNILISWTAQTSAGSGDGAGAGVTGRIFTAAGAPVTGDIVLNSYVTSTQAESSIAPNGAGGFVAVWSSYQQDGSVFGVYGQRFDAAGNTVGPEFLVNTTTASDQQVPEVAQLGDGGFVVVWQDQSGADGSGWGVFMQRYAADGTPVGGETQVNQYGYTTQSDAQASATPDGGWIVTWSDYSSLDGSGAGVFAQRYDSTGAPVDGPFRVNEQTSSTQDESDVAVLADGRIAVVWTSETSAGAGDGSSRGVFQRLFGDPATQGGGADPVVDGLTETVTVDEAAANAGYVSIAGAAAVSDADSANFDGGRLEIVRVESYRAGDQFAAPDGATQDFITFLSPRVTIVGTQVRVDGTTVGALVADGQAGARLEVSLNAQATAARVEALVEALSWRTPSNDPADSRDFRVTLTDGDGGAAEPRFITVAVTPEQDGEGPVGGERQANTFTAGAQTQSATAGLAGGGHVVVWQSYDQDDPQGNDQGVFGQVFDALGAPVGAEFQLSESFVNNQQQPAVAALPGGGFVAGWEGNGPGDASGVFLRLFDAGGQPTGPEIRVNELTSGSEENIRLATDATGQILAVWTDTNGDSSGYGVRARLYDASGAPLTGDTLVNTFQSSTQYYPDADALAGGGWIVAWSSYGQDGSTSSTYGVFGQRLAANGTPVGTEFQISTQVEGQQYLEGVAGLAGGGFVAVFRDENGTDGSGVGVYARLYDAMGAAQGEPFLVNERTTGSQRYSDVVALSDGGFVIAWEDTNGLDGSSWSVQGQRYDASGARVDGQFQINEQTASTQELPALAALAGGGFAASWTSNTSGTAGDGSGDGVFTRLFGDPAAFDRSGLPGLDGVNDAVAYLENDLNDAPQLIDADGAAAVIDPNGSGFAGGFVRAEMVETTTAYADQINPPDDLTQDALGLRAGGGIDVAGGAVTVDGVVVGTVVADGQAGLPFEIALNGAATAALVERLVENLTYRNVSDAPESSRTIRIQIADADGASDPQIVAVSIAPSGDSVKADTDFAERQANTTSAGEQTQPSVAATGDGFVMVWRSYNQDATNSYGIFGQRFDRDGVKVGSEFQVNATSAGNQSEPHVASVVGGGFVVTWQDQNGADGSGYGVFMQRYGADGMALGGETQVNAYASSTQYQPEATGLLNGDILVVWAGNTHTISGASGYDIYGRIFDGATGAAKTDDFRVNTETGGTQDWPHVAALADGGFVVGWETDANASGGGDLDSNAVLQRRYAFDAGAGTYAPVGAPEVVNASTPGAQVDISLAGLSGGGWVAVWRSAGQDGSSDGVFGQLFDVSGARMGEEFRVNDQRVGSQTDPEVTALPNGGFAVAYADSNSTDGSGWGVYVQQYGADGERRDGPRLVNTEISSTQDQPTIAALTEGDFVVGWRSVTSATAGDGSGDGVFYQIFDNTPPDAIDDAVSASEDGPAVTFSPTENDVDADGDDVEIVSVDTAGLIGVVTLGADGDTVTYDPNGQFETLAVGQTATETFDYTIGDRNGAFDTASITVTIDGVNDAPVAADDTGGVSEDGPAVTVVVTGNDTDIDNGDDPEVTALDTAGLLGSAVIGADADSVTYDPNGAFEALNEGETALETFGYAIDDSNGGTDMATVTVTVTGVNDAPTVAAGVLAADEDGPAVTLDLSALGDDADAEDDGASLSYAVVGAPSEGSASISGTTLSFAPGSAFQDLNAGQTRNVVAQVQATDMRGATSAIADVTVTVTGVNDAPTLAAGALAADEDGPAVTLDLSALGDDADAEDDGASLSYAIVGAPSEGSASISGTTLSFAPGAAFQDLNAGETRDVVVQVQATDMRGATSAIADITVAVTGVNDAPTLAAGALAADEDGPAVTLDLSALGDDADAEDDGASLSYAIVGAPSEGSASISGTTLSFAPGAAFQDLNAGETRDVVVQVQATDMRGATSAIADVAVTVTGANDAPVFTTAPAAVSVAENTTAVTTYAATDADAGQTPGYTIEGGADALLFAIDPVTGALRFRAAPDYELPGDAGGDNVYDVVVGADDGTVVSTQAVAVTVTDVNEGAAALVSIAVDDGSEPEGDAGARSVLFTVSRTGDTANAVLVFLAAFGTAAATDVSGAVPASVEIPAGQSSTSFSVDVLGDIEIETDETLGVRITGLDRADHAVATAEAVHVIVNDDAAPIAVGDAGAGFATTEDSTFVTASVLTNDSDPDGDLPLSVAAFDATGLAGMLSDNGDGTFAYDPNGAFEALNEGQTATETFTYTVSDAAGVTDMATVAITVAGVNDAPTLAAGALAAAEDGPAVTLDLSALGDDADAEDDGASLGYAIVGAPSEGSASISGTTLSFAPGAAFQDLNAGETRDVVVQVQAADMRGATSAIADVAVTVTGANDAPVFTTAPAAVSVAENTTAVTTYAATDADAGQTPGYTIEGGADALLFAIDPVTGALRFRAAPDYELPGDAGGDNVYDVVVGADDGTVVSTQAVAVTVTDVNEGPGNLPPTPADDAFTVAEDAPLSGDLFADNGFGPDSDPDQGDMLTVTAVNGVEAAVGMEVTLPTGAKVTVNANGTFAYDQAGVFDALNDGDAGADSFIYTVSDGSGETADAMVSITIEGETDAPPLNLVLGTDASERLTGTDGADLIRSLGGRSDMVAGLDGADIFDFSDITANGARELRTVLDYTAGEDAVDLGAATVASVTERAGVVTLVLDGEHDVIALRGVDQFDDVTFL